MYSALRTRYSTAATLAAVAAAFLVPGPAEAQRQHLTRYSTADGLPGARVTAIQQDSSGYLWFGTDAGLARYDGSSYRVLTTTDGLASNAVAAVAMNGAGRLLVASSGGGIDMVWGELVSPLRGEIAGRGRPQALLADSRGVVWVATDGGAGSEDQEGISALAASLPVGCCTVVLRDRRDRVWLGSAAGLYRLHQGVVSRVDGPSARIQALVDGSDGLWVGTSSGLYREQAGRLVAVASTPKASITALAAAPAGGLWLGTDAGEVIRLGASPLRIDRASGLPEGPVHALLVDREGSLWIGTDDGVVKWVATSFVTFDDQAGLPGAYIVDVVAAGERGVWVATRDGLARVNADGRVSGAIAAPQARINAAAAGPDDELVIASGRRLWVIEDDRGPVSWLDAPEDVTAIAVGARTTWVGTSLGLYEERDGELVAASGFPPGQAVAALALGGDGAMPWVGTRGIGLLRRTEGGFEVVAGVPPGAIWDLAVDPDDGSVWAATNGLGLLRVLPDGRVLRLTRQNNGLVSDFIQQVVPVGQGRVWAYTNHGLDLWDPTLGITHYGQRDGLPSSSGSPGAGTADDGGRLWFGTPAGLALYRPPRESVPAPPLQVRIEEVTHDGEGVDSDALGRLGPEVGVLSFRYTALTFRDERSTRFQYRLRGRTERWSRLTPERQVSFVGLPPGEYVFEVQAIDDLGRWSDVPASAAVVISPALWQRPEARAAMAGLALLVLLALFRSRLRTVEDERLRLRRMVDKRTLELVEKNALLERMATTDELTGLSNRRFFLESMQRELRKMARSGIDDELSLLVIDLDRFKSINDRFGHAAGDEVLRQVARRLARGVRATDLPARYGGEEFAILLPSTGVDGGRFLGEKLRADLEALDMRFEGSRIPVTISVGVASLRTPQRYEPELEEQLLKRADEAMYRAKTGGRNRVIVAD